MTDDGCTLLSLPPEIRNTIFGYVLTIDSHEYAGHIKIGRRLKSGNNRTTYSVQALLQTCRQTYNEAAGMYYLVNHITVSSLQVKAFVGTTSPQRLRFIRRLAIEYARWHMGSFKFLEYLPQLPHLERLTIVLSNYTLSECEGVLRDEGRVELQLKTAKSLNLRKVEVLLRPWRDSGNGWSPWQKELDSTINALHVAFDTAMVGGKVTRAIEEAWAKGVVLRKIGGHVN